MVFARFRQSRFSFGIGGIILALFGLQASIASEIQGGRLTSWKCLRGQIAFLASWEGQREIQRSRDWKYFLANLGNIEGAKARLSSVGIRITGVGADATANPHELSLVYDGKQIAHIQIQSDGSTLVFDITVEPKYRRSGAYTVLLEYAVKAFPELESIPSRMLISKSDNAKQFATNAFGSPSEFSSYRNGARLISLSRSDLVTLRNRLIEAFKSTPAYKARSRAGFSRIEKIILDPVSGALSFDVKKGEPADYATAVIIIPQAEKPGAPRLAKKITYEGDLRAAWPEDLSLSAYDRLKPQGWKPD